MPREDRAVRRSRSDHAGDGDARSGRSPARGSRIGAALVLVEWYAQTQSGDPSAVFERSWVIDRLSTVAAGAESSTDPVVLPQLPIEVARSIPRKNMPEYRFRRSTGTSSPRRQITSDGDARAEFSRREHRRPPSTLLTKGSHRISREAQELFAFAEKWVPYGGPPSDEIMIEFGMSRRRFNEALWATIEEADCDKALIYRLSRVYPRHQS